MDKKYISEIIEAAEKDKLVFFVGAGVSTVSKYPRWSDLIKKMDSILSGKEKDKYSSEELLQIPQMLFYKDQEEYRRILTEFFLVDVSVNDVHRKMAQLNPRHYITTNYDDLIEKSIRDKGGNYSVISKDSNVSKSKYDRYILKVHGDLSLSNQENDINSIVLKENDYIEYEDNFPMISTMMKSIVATNCIVFIGYGLGDYNIKLILNWVKKIQKESYNKPYFIHVGESELNENEVKYYSEFGLRIVDVPKLMKSSKSTYEERYNYIMDEILNYSDLPEEVSDEVGISYFMNLIEPLSLLNYVRRVDLRKYLEKYYLVGLDGVIIPKGDLKYDFLFKANSHLKYENSILHEKCLTINNFMATNSINKYWYSEKGFEYKTDLTRSQFYIKNEMFDWSGYDIYGDLLNKEYQSNQYERAFVNVLKGEYYEAYVLYSEIINQSMENSDKVQYYFSYINRYWLYKGIKALDNQYGTPFSAITNGGVYKIFSEQELDRIDSDNKYINIDSVFDTMDIDFKKAYRFLEPLSSLRFFDEIMKTANDLIEDVEKDIKPNHFISGGNSKNKKIEDFLYSNITFAYENHLCFIYFNEFKKYVKKSIETMVKKYLHDKEIQSQQTDNDVFLYNYNSFKMNKFFYICTSRFFSKDDLKALIRSYNLRELKFDDQEEILSYVVRIREIYKSNFVGQYAVRKLPLFQSIKDEVVNAISLSAFLDISKEMVEDNVDFLLNIFPEREMLIGDKILLIRNLCPSQEYSLRLIAIIEQFMVNQFLKYSTSNYEELTSNGLGTKELCSMLRGTTGEYKSEVLSKFVKNHDNYNDKTVNYMFKFCSVLDEEACRLLLKCKKDFTLDDWKLIEEFNFITDMSPYNHVLFKELDMEKARIENESNGVYMVSGRSVEVLVEIGLLYYLKRFKDDRVKEYIGLSDEFDFFVNPTDFDYTKFSFKWLEYYTEGLIIDLLNDENILRGISAELKMYLINNNNRVTKVIMSNMTKKWSSIIFD